MKAPVQIDEYFEGEVIVRVFAPAKEKRARWQKNDTFYSSKMRITDDRMFARFTRKKGKG